MFDFFGEVEEIFFVPGFGDELDGGGEAVFQCDGDAESGEAQEIGVGERSNGFGAGEGAVAPSGNFGDGSEDEWVSIHVCE